MTAPFIDIDAATAAQFMATKENQRIRDVIAGRVAGRFVVDLGCGRGIGATAYSPLKYIGLDCSAALVEKARRDNPLHHFFVNDIRKPVWGRYECGILKSVLEHQESLDDALAIYANALDVCGEVYVAWHTPPTYPETEIIRVDACDLNHSVYQNHYREGAFDREDVSVSVENVDEFTLWTARRR